ncbi:hypothetical protein L596_024383 [Steinernema carpocapsae]|uniref:Kinetochore protein NDC80 n=1 Tax=Steinernema carpocapsae TaxID=34508 RepID=A0A4U5MHB2_STECR|nr:hypothetical protein L596_024383 [Steinernema carpocapsae]
MYNKGRSTFRAPQTPKAGGAAIPNRLPSTGRASDMRRMSWTPSSANRLSGFTGRPSVSTLAITKPDCKKKNKEKILKFLSDFGHDAASMERVISTKSGYKMIFEFIIGRIFNDENFAIGDKLESEIPEIMKRFDYPYNIKAAYFQPIGVMHTFPHLLAILAFLVDIFETYEQMSENPPSALHFNDSQDSTTHAYNYAFILTTFNKCNDLMDGMATEEFLEQERDAYIEAFNNQDELAEELNEWLDREDDMKHDREALEKGKVDIEQAEKRLKDREAGIEKCMNFHKMSVEANVERTSNLKELEAKEQEYRTQIDSVNSQIEEVRSRLARQSMTGEKAREVNQECESIADNIRVMDEEHQKMLAAHDSSTRAAMKQGNLLKEHYVNLVSILENMWRSVVTGADRDRIDFAKLQSVNPIHIDTALVEGGDIQKIVEKIHDVAHKRDEAVSEGQLNIKSELARFENKIREVLSQINATETERYKILETRKRARASHEQDVHQLKLALEVAQGEKKLYDQERPDILEMREKLHEAQMLLRSTEVELEKKCVEKTEGVFAESDDILRHLEEFEICEKEIVGYEKDVLNSFRNVLNCRNV